MSVAPLNGRSDRLRLVTQQPDAVQRMYRLPTLKTAPLSSRARRLRRRRFWTLALNASLALLVLSVMAWAVVIWRA